MPSSVVIAGTQQTPHSTQARTCTSSTGISRSAMMRPGEDRKYGKCRRQQR